MKNVKNFLLTAFLFMSTVCFSQQSANPLANTEWNGIANIPSPEEITFNPDSALENKQSQRDDLIKDRMKSY